MSDEEYDVVASAQSYAELLEHPERIGELLKKKHEVGYRRPPKGSQFKPGHSGNPKGRPKGSKNLRISLERIFTKTVSVRKGDRVHKVSSLEAVIMTNINKALKGDQRAIEAVYKLAKELQLLLDKPQRLIIDDDLQDFTREEVEEFRRLCAKANARTVST